MPTYNSPDVYIEEVSSGFHPIEAVGTSVAAFVGEAPRRDAPRNVAVGVNNWREFHEAFVGDVDDDTVATPLVHAVWGFFQNLGGRCYVVNLGSPPASRADDKDKKDKPPAEKPITAALAALQGEDAVAIVAAPGFHGTAAHEALLTHCETMQDRVCVLDGPPRVDKVSLLAKTATKGGEGLKPRPSEQGYGAFYYPWLVVRDPLHPAREAEVPPSGHVAGVYARSDATRGVHKAPANEPLRGVLGVTHRLTRFDQDEIYGSGVNCIRYFSAQGILLWGARTLATSGEWRYVSVRRLFNMIEESIAKSTRWIVFEPNDEPLWKMIVRDVTAFLTLLWRDGALMGSSPQEAFFVKCDAETNPPEVVDAGRVVTRIGIAPVKPAEFVVFQIGQHAGGTEIRQ